MKARFSAESVLLTAVLLAASSGCATTSCPGLYLNPIVHVDATAWTGSVGLTPIAFTATVCVAFKCIAAVPVRTAEPSDVLVAADLPAGNVTVRVQLATSDGRTLDQTTTAKVTLTKPLGSGCGGRQEIDLTVTKSGSLVPGQPAKVL